MTVLSAEYDPVDAAKKAQKAYKSTETTYRDDQYKSIGEISRITSAFRKSDEKYKAFLQENFFSNITKGRGRKRDTSDIVRHVTYYVTNADCRSKQKTVDKIVSVIKYLRRIQIKPKFIPEYMHKNGGIDSLLEQAREYQIANPEVSSSVSKLGNMLYINATADQIKAVCEVGEDEITIKVQRLPSDDSGFVPLVVLSLA